MKKNMTVPPPKRIYLDHAATSYPKPISVLEAVTDYIQNQGASAGRGAYHEAFEAKKILEETRSLLTAFFNAPNPERMVFTANATDGLNLALLGLLQQNDHVITSSIEHNSVSRPLIGLQQRKNVSYTKIPVTIEGEVDFSDFERALKPNTKCIAFIHASNVSGSITPIAEIGAWARRKGLPLLVDASQTAGAYPIDVEAMKIDLLAFPGHKSLLAPLGTGGLWVRSGIELENLKEGGTGSFSEDDAQPKTWPDRHESGSHNLVGIVGIKASLEFLNQTGVEKIRAHKEDLVRFFLEGLRGVPNIKIIAAQNPKNNAGVVSLFLDETSPHDLAHKLDELARIQVRPGLHCAPWAHRTFGSYPKGTVRFSFGESNTVGEVEVVLKALRKTGIG